MAKPVEKILHSTLDGNQVTQTEIKPPDGAKSTTSDAVKAFQQRWHDGERVKVEDYLKTHPDLGRDIESLLDLIYVEYVVREKRGEKPSAEEYFQRFPACRDRLDRLFALDAALGDSEPRETQGGGAVTTLPAIQVSTIGRYVVVGEIGSGGQAKVFRAVHPNLGREVIVKLAHAPLDGDVPRDELVREGRLLASLDHPNLAHVHDLDFFEGRPFLVMEYVPGRTLEQQGRQSRLTPEASARLVAALARAVAAIHKAGVVHRDIKPRNVVLDAANAPRLIDFGLAAWTNAWSKSDDKPGVVQGTIAYMAPEQARGDHDQVGPAADLFSLGGVLFFLLTGKSLYGGDNALAALEHAQAGDYDRAALDHARAPEALKAICRRLLALNPQERFPDAESLAAALDAVSGRSMRRTWITASAVLALSLFGALALALGWRGASGPAVVPVTHPILRVQVAQGKGFIDLPGGLQAGDRFRAAVSVPASTHAALFLLTSEGKLKALVQASPAAADQVLPFPDAVNEAARLVGSPGTEFLFVVGRRQGAITAEELQPLFAQDEPWPELPELSLLRLQTDGVVIEQSGRDIDLVKIGPNPQEVVRRRLERLRDAFKSRFDYFEGLAFAHSE